MASIRSFIARYPGTFRILGIVIGTLVTIGITFNSLPSPTKRWAPELPLRSRSSG